MEGAAQPAFADLDVAAVAARPRRSPTELSVTSLVSYTRCPKQFYWQVVRPLPRRSSAAALVGSAVHRWIERRADPQLVLLPPADEPDELAPSEPVKPGMAEKLQQSFLASPYATLDPQRVEAPFVLVLGRHLVRGRIDAVYERSGRLELVDFKTGRPPVAGDASAGVQLDIYALAALDAWRADPARLRTTYCYLRPDGPAQLDSSDWQPSRVTAVRARLIATLDDLAAARYTPTPGGWCRPCDFLSACAPGRAELDRAGIPRS